MDVSILRSTLEIRDVRTAAGQELSDSGAPDIAEEIFSRYRNSTQPESQQLCTILSAILEVIKTEGLQATPTALFAALMCSIEDADSAASPDVTVAICTLLSTVLGRVPINVMRSRSMHATQVLVRVIEDNGNNLAIVKAAFPCLCQLLSATGGQDWPAMSRGFNIVLSACLASQPKLRKKAQSGLVDIFAALEPSPTLMHASNAVLKTCQSVLPLPEAAAQAAAAAPAKRRQQAEQAIKAAVADALHLMGLMKMLISFLSGT